MTYNVFSGERVMVEEHVHTVEAAEGAEARPPEPKKYRYISKTSKIGGVDVTLYSIDGATWSSRKDELVNILERHEQERTAFGGELRGQTASMRYGKGMRRGHQKQAPKADGDTPAAVTPDESEEPMLLETEEADAELEAGADEGDGELLEDDIGEEGAGDEEEDADVGASKRRKAKLGASKSSILDEIADEVDETVVGSQSRAGRGKGKAAAKAVEKLAKPEKSAKMKAPAPKPAPEPKAKSAKKAVKPVGKTPPPKLARKETPRAAGRDAKKPAKGQAKPVAVKKRAGK